MKILLVHNDYLYKSGEETYVDSLRDLLSNKGHIVYLFRKKSSSILSLKSKIKTAIGLFWNPSIEQELCQVIETFRPDIVHLNNIYPLIGATLYYVTKRYNLPIVQTVHNYRLMCPKGTMYRNNMTCTLCVHKPLPFWSILFNCYHGSRLASFFYATAYYYHHLRGGYKLIDKWIFPSEFTEKLYMKERSYIRNKSVYIPYFIPRISETTVLPTIPKHYFLYIGGFSENKGILNLLQFFCANNEHRLIVFGSGYLQLKVNSYNKYPNIVVKGYTNKKKLFEYIRGSSGVIVPSLWYEVLPFVIIEALQNNKPVVIRENSNLKMSFGKYKSTYFFKDFNELGRILKTILSKSLSNLKIIPEFTPEYHYSKLIECYESAITKKRY